MSQFRWVGQPLRYLAAHRDRRNARFLTLSRIVQTVLRHTYRDCCGEQSYPRDLLERASAHTVENNVEATYHRTDLLDQRHPMMKAWSNYYGTREHL